MKNLIFIAVALFFTSTCVFAQKAGKADTLKHATYYSCPHHPGVTGHIPGKCPKCGMALTLTPKEQMKANEMKNYACPIHVDVAMHNPGKCPKCGEKLNLSPKEQMRTEAMRIYTCPMHTSVALDKDGICPKCGKDLIEKKTD